MAMQWTTPDALTDSLVTTEINSLANAAESAQFTYDNSSGKKPHALMTIKLGSYTPTADTVLVRVLSADGTNTPDKAGGEVYKAAITVSSGAKTAIISQIRIYPFVMYFSIINNTGAAFASANNAVYLRAYSEEDA